MSLRDGSVYASVQDGRTAIRQDNHDVLYCNAPEVDASPPWTDGGAGGGHWGMGGNCTAAAQFLSSNFAATTTGANVNEPYFYPI